MKAKYLVSVYFTDSNIDTLNFITSLSEEDVNSLWRWWNLATVNKTITSTNIKDDNENIHLLRSDVIHHIDFEYRK